MTMYEKPWSVWSSQIAHLSITQTAGLVVVVSIPVVMVLKKVFISDSKSPPGPWGYPVLGHLPLLGRKPYIAFNKFRKLYGDIVGLRFGSWPAVVLSGDKIKEALCNKGDAFSGRPQWFSSVKVQDGKSLSFGKFDAAWKLHRRIANNAFTTFANARNNPIEEIVQEAVDRLVSDFEDFKGKEFDPHDHVFLAVASIIYQICYGRNENVREDKDFCEYILHTEDFSKFVSAGNPVDVFPWLRFFLKEHVTKFNNLLEKGVLIRRKRIKEQVVTFDKDHQRGILDNLIHNGRSLTASEKEMGMSPERVQDTIGDMFAAGFDTVATTTMWVIILLASHRDIQQKLQDELNDVVGSRRATLADRNKLTYLEATIHEVMRVINLLPLSTPHCTTEDVELGGYLIKKDTVVFVNLHSLSHDPNYWVDPDVFRPERFLTDTGEIDSARVNKFYPFSTGRRRCLGEPLARIELFLILSGLMQRFTFVKPDSVSEYSMDSEFGLNQKPYRYKVEANIRN